ncbi:MAG: hypothetical protein SVX43_12595 [Cyanobacteriota bacterium]|nr:hypothetical protein [Cyanobacteriota bacterium]
MLKNSQKLSNGGCDSYLGALREEPLEKWAKKNSVKDVYRFTFIPTLDPPQVLRTWKCRQQQHPFQALYKLGSADPEGTSGAIDHQVSWNPSQSKWNTLMAAIAQNFWMAPAWKSEDRQQGSLWIFEGYRDGEYQRRESWYGKDPRACTLGRAFRKFIPGYLGEKLLCFRSLIGDRFGQIAYEHLEAGRFIQALKIAQSHKSDYIKILTLDESKIFSSWTELPLEDKLALLVRAVETAASIEDLQNKAPILRDLALKYASVGQLNRALQVAYRIEIPDYRVVLLDYLCDRYAAEGRGEEVARIRTDLLLAAQKIQGQPHIEQLTPIVLKHAQQERLDSKFSRLVKSWLSHNWSLD